MVRDLVRNYWASVERSGELCGKSPVEKRELFRRMRVVFPTVVVPESVPGTFFVVDFRMKRQINEGQTCFCGSGLPYASCCGRTVSCEELTGGPF
jgi:hypothetical protein